MSAFPDKYQTDYLVMHSAEIVGGLKQALETNYLDLVKITLFKKFDSWVESEYSKGK